MAFLKKLEKQKEQDIEKARQRFINGGGLVVADIEQKEENKEKWLKILLRIRSDIVEKIDELIKDRIGITRTAWILEAIQEKIKKDQ